MITSMLRRAQLTAGPAPGGPPSPSWTLDFSTGTPSGYTLTRASTGTYVDSSGYVASASTDIARLTHNSSGSRLGLLVEEQRTNLVQRSGEYENAYWNDISNTTCAGVASPTAPDNSTDAAQLTETTANGIHARGGSAVTTSTGAITLSAYVKKGSRQYVGLYHITIGGNSYRAIFDLDNNAAFSAGNPSGTPNASYGSESVGNGWFRIWITLTAGNATGYPGVFLSDRAGFTGTLASGMPSYTGSTSESVYVWGLQMENAATPSSYIPTVASTVTRSADIASVATSNITGFANNSTLLVEYYRPATTGMVTATNEAVSSMGKTGYIGVRSTATATQSDLAWDTSFTQSGANGNLTGTVNATLQKFAYTINSGGTVLKSCMNGSMLTTTKTGGDPDMTLSDTLFLGQEEGGISYSNVIIRKVAFYNSVLSDADMQTITT